MQRLPRRPQFAGSPEQGNPESILLARLNAIGIEECHRTIVSSGRLCQLSASAITLSVTELMKSGDTSGACQEFRV
ncbi:hypothetical protein AS149_38860 [Burkholderia cenocepacia]|nr:hypothetical protein AS149_38860 [Burkholderia cenocepacia]